MLVLNANIRAFNSYAEAPKFNNPYFRGCFELPRTNTSQTKGVGNRERGRQAQSWLRKHSLEHKGLN